MSKINSEAIDVILSADVANSIELREIYHAIRKEIEHTKDPEKLCQLVEIIEGKPNEFTGLHVDIHNACAHAWIRLNQIRKD